MSSGLFPFCPFSIDVRLSQSNGILGIKGFKAVHPLVLINNVLGSVCSDQT